MSEIRTIKVDDMTDMESAKQACIDAGYKIKEVNENEVIVENHGASMYRDKLKMKLVNGQIQISGDFYNGRDATKIKNRIKGFYNKALVKKNSINIGYVFSGEEVVKNKLKIRIREL